MKMIIKNNKFKEGDILVFVNEVQSDNSFVIVQGVYILEDKTEMKFIYNVKRIKDNHLFMFMREENFELYAQEYRPIVCGVCGRWNE